MQLMHHKEILMKKLLLALSLLTTFSSYAAMELNCDVITPNGESIEVNFDLDSPHLLNQTFNIADDVKFKQVRSGNLFLLFLTTAMGESSVILEKAHINSKMSVITLSLTDSNGRSSASCITREK